MTWYVDLQITVMAGEIYGHKQRLAVGGAHKRVLTMWIESRILIVYIHQIEETTLTQCLLAVAQSKYAAI